jgi:hypothetical protein
LSRSNRRLLGLLLASFNLLAASGVYLLVIRVGRWLAAGVAQNYFYQYVFLAHLAVGFAVLLPVLWFLVTHYLAAHHHRNRKAVLLGKRLAVAVVIVLGTGLLLTRLENVVELHSPSVRLVMYWLHVVVPLLLIPLYVAHRRRGPAIQWVRGRRHLWGAAALVLAMVALHASDPRVWLATAPASGEEYFEPSLARTSTGNFIDASTLVNDEYCKQCHADAHRQWMHSAHHFSSFNNPAYLASVRETRSDLAKRDGHARASRFCAGCHDPAPFFSGSFDDPKFDDPQYDLASDPLAQAGITCTACHSITHVNSPRGNADYVIEEPLHYPFAFSENPWLQWVNRTLIRANPEFHKTTFLKPVHKTPEFCGSCHKVHLPQELNDYKFLPGQNHYDSFLLSGVSGHGLSSFYYPPKAEPNCNNCHMQLVPSDDLGAKQFAGATEPSIHNHMFPAANTAIPALVGAPDEVIEAHKKFNQGKMRVDLFGIRDDGTLAGEFRGPLDVARPTLEPGRRYLLETVIRTLGLGHHFTQGTADSNQVWLDITIKQGDKVIGRSGGRNPQGEVDPWSHFVNAFVIDRDGRRIDRRNAEDIFVILYNNQIPPGAGQAVHYAFEVPSDSTEPIEIEAKLQYRKFDTFYLRYFLNDPNAVNDLPVMLLAEDRVVLPVAGGSPVPDSQPDEFPMWQRWNDYGIGLLGGPGKGAGLGALRQAELAFAEVEKLGRGEGPTNRARVYLKEGRLADAVEALAVAAKFDPPPARWTHHLLVATTNAQNGDLDAAIEHYRAALLYESPETVERGFDFSLDYRVWNELGSALIERSKRERSESQTAAREEWLQQAADAYLRSLAIDPENVAAHYGLAQAYGLLGEEARAEHHRALHAKYKIDDNARERAIIAARQRYPAADFAAEAIVIWDLQRDEAYDYNRD